MTQNLNTASNSQTLVASEAAPTVSRKRKLSTSAADLMAERDGLLPVWVRAPRGGGTEFFSGQTRATLYSWAAQGFIKSVSIRTQKNQIKGIRCFLLSSILAFIEKCEAEANANANTSAQSDGEQ